MPDQLARKVLMATLKNDKPLCGVMPVWSTLVRSAATVREGMWGQTWGTGLSDQTCPLSDHTSTSSSHTIGDPGACTRQIWPQEGEWRDRAADSTPHRCTATEACKSSAEDAYQSSASPKHATKSGPQDSTEGTTQAGTLGGCCQDLRVEGWQKQWRGAGPALGKCGRYMRVDITQRWEGLPRWLAAVRRLTAGSALSSGDKSGQPSSTRYGTATTSSSMGVLSSAMPCTPSR